MERLYVRSYRENRRVNFRIHPRILVGDHAHDFVCRELEIFPTSGYGTWQHFILPSIVLAAFAGGVLMRLTRAAMLEVMQQSYILTARSKGLKQRVILFRHALQNAMIPVVTVLGTYFGAILGGSVIVEVIFALPGIGRFAIDGIFR